jgi:hypothetical protein
MPTRPAWTTAAVDDLYFELADVKPPVAGGPAPSDRTTTDRADLEVARQLGQGRPQIAGAYLGNRVQATFAHRDQLENSRPSGSSRISGWQG